jgi:hypothetical protein
MHQEITKLSTKPESENHNRGVYLEDLGTEGRMVLKHTLKNYIVSVQTACLEYGQGQDLLNTEMNLVS